MFFRVILPLIAVGLAVYALADCAASDEEERGGIPKGLWIVLIIFLPLLGPTLWIFVKRSQRSRHGAGGRGTPPTRFRGSGTGSGAVPRPRRRGPVAPDDDPEFLWRLEQEKRRRERENGTDGADDGTTPPAGDAPAGTGTGTPVEEPSDARRDDVEGPAGSAGAGDTSPDEGTDGAGSDESDRDGRSA